MDKENHRTLLNGSRSAFEIKGKNAPLRMSNSKKSLAKNESYQTCMKYLIANNAEYFQNKLRTNPFGRSKQLKLKMPSKTGSTVYKRDYHQKQIKYKNQDSVKHNMSVDCIKTNNFLKDQHVDLRFGDKSMYQSDFKGHHIRSGSNRKLVKRVGTVQNEDDDAPRFFQTQNKLDFLNWGGKNYVPSMKPQQRAAVTNVPFEASSVYKSDFEGKTVTQTPIYIREPSLVKFGCSSPMMKTSYNDDYSKKRSGTHQIDCRPKYFETSICKKFKGTTEYKREFIKERKDEETGQTMCSVEQLQTLIIDL